MPFNSLEQTNTELQGNPQLSEHNKEILDRYFQQKRSKVGGAQLANLASRFNTLAPHIDFPLDEVEKSDIRKLIAAINQDEIRRNDGKPYSDYSKRSLYSAIANLYTELLDREEWFEKDFQNPVETEPKVEPDKIPSPQQIKDIASQADSLRDQALIVFGWATGARIGELVQTSSTHEYPKGIKWEDIRFKGDEMLVTLRGKTGEREIPIRTGMPLMKRLQDESMKSLSDHVFKKKQVTNLCPKCGSSISTEQRKTQNYNNRTYNCDSSSCSWSGKHHQANKVRKPLDDSSARKRLKALMSEADVPERLHNTPHKVFRKGRALYWASQDKRENFLRGFFGWSGDSDAPLHYVELMSESLLAGIREHFGEELSDDEKRFKDGSLEPFNCPRCDAWGSPLWSYCKSCDLEFDDELRYHNKPDEKEREAEAAMETMVDLAQETGIPEDDFRELANRRMKEMKEEQV